jgi:two-component system, NarL family, sensor histidine kinase DesK
VDAVTEPHDPATRPSGQLPTAAPGPAADPSAVAPSRGVTATWWYTFVSMAFFALFLPMTFLVVQRGLVQDAGGAPNALVTAVEVLFVAGALTSAYGCHLLRAGLGSGAPRLRDAVVVLGPPALAWLMTLWLPGAAMTGAFPLWMAMNILLPVLESTGRRMALTAGVVLYAVHWWLGVQVAGEVPDDRYLVSLLIFAVVCPLLFLLSTWWWNVVVTLDGARRDAAQLAVARERLRFASDLHDIQGHHLQVIALKAELAERLLDRDPQAARQNIHEVRTLARTALEETRSLVRDLREVSLEEELANARDVLVASGAGTTVRTVEVTDPSARTLLGLAVREAATNILRHSTATTVGIALSRRSGELLLRVENDGATGCGDDGAAPGTGLAGLHRRFAASGGAVTGRHDGNRFVLEARLPAAPVTTSTHHRGDR